MGRILAVGAAVAWWYCKWWSRREKAAGTAATGFAQNAMTRTAGRPSRRGPGIGQRNVPKHPLAEAEPDEEPIAETDTVEAWRFDQLMAAGYPIELAHDLARNPRVDLHYAVELVGRTSPDLAFQILT